MKKPRFVRRKKTGSRKSKNWLSQSYDSLEPRNLLATVAVANYANDFAQPGGGLASGWDLQWNAPVNGDHTTGSVLDPQTVFASLKYTGSFTRWTPDGDLNPRSQPDASYLRLSRLGGHPGASAEVFPNGVARYSIASYTVGESGFYEIADSHLGVNPVNPLAKSDGVEFLVFVNRNTPVRSGVVTKGTYGYFDTSLGFLKSGDTIHVAFGANGNHFNDYFTTDFSVVRDVEREQTVGQFRNEFVSGGAKEFGWNYFWNAPDQWRSDGSHGDQRTGAMGNPDSYVPLQLAGSQWTADGDLNGLNSRPDNHLRIGESGGHVGRGISNPAIHDRFAIVGFTVEHSGLYALTNSFVSVSDLSTNGIEAFVHVGDGPRLTDDALIFTAGESSTMDMSLGYVSKGETIYVGFGANGNHVHDYFQMDFSIVRSLPRAAPDLGLLEHEGEIVSVNDRYFGDAGAIPGDHQDDWQAFKNAFEYALASGANEVRMDKGIYDLSSAALSSPAPLFILDGARDLVINGNGSTLILSDYTRSLFVTHFSTNIIFKDMIIDYAERVPAQGIETNDLYKPLTFTQGIISKLNPVENTFTLTVNTQAFVAPDDSFTNFIAQGWGYALDSWVDGRLKVGSEWHYPTLSVKAGSTEAEFTIKVWHTDGLANGDRYVMQRRHNQAMFGFRENSNNISLINVTAYSAPSVFVGALQSQYVNVIDSNVVIRPDDWTSTPDTQRWKSINADGIHAQSNRVGVWVENSKFDGLSDDVMNFYSLPMTIYEKISDTRFTLASIAGNKLGRGAANPMLVGDHLSFFDSATGQVFKEARIVAIHETTIPNPDDPDGAGIRLQTVTLDQPVASTVIGNDTDGPGYRNDTTVFNMDSSRSALVQDSTLSNSRRYGNFLMASNVQLIDNVYEGLSDEAIAAHNEPGWPLGLFAEDILIQGNMFIDNGFSNPYLSDEFHAGVVAFQAARYLDPNAPDNIERRADFLVESNDYVHSNIQIRDNVFYHWRKSAISIRNAENVTVVGNSVSAGLETNVDEPAADPFQIYFSQHVSFDSNNFVGGRIAVSAYDNQGFSHTNTQFVTDDGLEAWLKFDKGAVLKDSSGNGVVPLFHRAGITTGRLGAAALFNGNNSITLAGLESDATNSRTVSLWFDVNNANLVSRKQVIYEEGNQNRGLNIYIDDGELYIGAWSAGVFSTFMHTSVESLQWNHVALVIDSGSSKLRGYLNGRKFGAGLALPGPPLDDEISLGRVDSTGTRFHTGLVSGEGNGFAGRIDDVRVYSRVLGDGEISGLGERI